MEIYCLLKQVGPICIFRRRPPLQRPLSHFFVGYADTQVIENFSRYAPACRYAKELRRRIIQPLN